MIINAVNRELLRPLDVDAQWHIALPGGIIDNVRTGEADFGLQTGRRTGPLEIGCKLSRITRLEGPFGVDKLPRFS
jgi:hypothetical protein